jgi:hypothetical protein
MPGYGGRHLALSRSARGVRDLKGVARFVADLECGNRVSGNILAGQELRPKSAIPGGSGFTFTMVRNFLQSGPDLASLFRDSGIRAIAREESVGGGPQAFFSAGSTRLGRWTELPSTIPLPPMFSGPSRLVQARNVDPAQIEMDDRSRRREDRDLLVNPARAIPRTASCSVIVVFDRDPGCPPNCPPHCYCFALLSAQTGLFPNRLLQRSCRFQPDPGCLPNCPPHCYCFRCFQAQTGLSPEIAFWLRSRPCRRQTE